MSLDVYLNLCFANLWAITLFYSRSTCEHLAFKCSNSLGWGLILRAFKYFRVQALFASCYSLYSVLGVSGFAGSGGITAFAD